MAVRVEQIADTRDRLGEGVLWDAQEKLLYWVDAYDHEVNRLNPASGEQKSWKFSDEVFALAFCANGDLLVSSRTHAYRLNPKTGAVTTPWSGLRVTEPDYRFNDGKVDSSGRFITGTMQKGLKNEGICYAFDGSKAVALGPSGHCFNGPSFSPDGKTFYFADSIQRDVFAFDYDPASGKASNKRIFAHTEFEQGSADGCTVDADGRLWAALCVGGAVGCFGRDGKLERTVDLPVMFPTSVAFGGPNLDVLYVTSIGEVDRLLTGNPNLADMAKRRPAGCPDGAVFAIHGLGVKGKPEPRFAG